MPAKGQTNNPNGRPPKGRAIAERISKAFAKSYTGQDGKGHNAVTILADVLVNAVINGEAILPNGKKLELSPRDWLELIKFLLVHVDGPARTAIELTGKDGAPVQMQNVPVTPEELRAEVERAALKVAELEALRAKELAAAQVDTTEKAQ